MHIAIPPLRIDSDRPFGAGGCFPGEMSGKLTDPNQLHGEMNDAKTGIGTSQKGIYTYNVKWDLGRQGSLNEDIAPAGKRIMGGGNMATGQNVSRLLVRLWAD